MYANLLYINVKFTLKKIEFALIKNVYSFKEI